MADATLPRRAFDTLTYHRADGTDIEFGPAEGGYKPVNQPVLRVLLDRGKPDGSLGEWRPLAAPPVPPPPPARPPLPKLTIQEPPPGTAATARPEGLWDQSLAHVHVRGCTQNIVQMRNAERAYANVRSTHALRNSGAHANTGQGVYAERGRHAFREYYAGWNGWRPTAAAHERRWDRCHGIYANTGTHVDGEDLLLVGNAWAGAQLRGTSRLRRVVCIGNAVGLASVYGPHEWAEVTVYEGGYVESGGDWAGNTGLYVWSPTTVRDVWIVGSPAVAVSYPHPSPGPKPGQPRAFDGGAVKLDFHHPQYPAAPNPTLDARDCVVAGWAPSTEVLEKHGRRDVFDRYDGRGFAVKPDPVAYDWRPVVAAVESNEISIREAVRTLTDGIRGLVK